MDTPHEPGCTESFRDDSGSQWAHPMSLAALSHLEMIPEDESYCLGRRHLFFLPQYGVRRRALQQWQPVLGL